MEELVDDYLNYNKKVKDDPNISGESAKNLLETAKRKKESENLALKVVEFLIEGKLRQQAFTKCLHYINPAYYQDVVDERSIVKICGYPLCGKILPNMPNQQYSICTKQNKVYDIVERKKFCSNICYTASLHIKNQIDSSPLWLRTYDSCTEFRILSLKERGFQGEEVLQVLEKPDEDSAPHISDFTSISSFTEYGLNGIIKDENQSKVKKYKVKEIAKVMPPVLETTEENSIEDDKEASRKSIKSHKQYTGRHSIKRKNSLKSTMKPIIENDESEKLNEEKQTKNTSNSCNKENHSHNINKKLNEEQLLITKKTDEEKLLEITKRIKNNLKISKTKLVEPLPIKTDRSGKTSSLKLKVTDKKGNEIETEIKSILTEWITLETLIFYNGESAIREVLKNKSCEHHLDDIKVTELEDCKRQMYKNICRMLRLQEINECSEDAKLQPVPDYKTLKKEKHDLDLKVRTFYDGKTYEADDQNFPNISENRLDADDSLALPLLDDLNQNILRRKIVLGSLTKSVTHLCQTINLNLPNLTSDLQNLVKTFYLTAENIVFKPIIWKHLAVIVLKIFILSNQKFNKNQQIKSVLDELSIVQSEMPCIEDVVKCTKNLLENIELFIDSYLDSLPRKKNNCI